MVAMYMFLCVCVLTMSQPTSERDGMINIRSEEDLEFDELGYTPEQLAEVTAMGADPNVYRKMARSICPNVWGSEDIKKAILLMLVGGVHKKTHEVGAAFSD